MRAAKWSGLNIVTPIDPGKLGALIHAAFAQVDLPVKWLEKDNVEPG